MPEIPFPRGVRDLRPNAALFRNELLKKIESVYQRFGFTTIDTPVFESLKILRAKDAIGEEGKLIYEIKDEDLGLRYDYTVSLARFYAMHTDVPLPFKRYVIGKVWRMDEPQRNRYRELTQADIDILGGNPVYTDAEVIAAAAKALEAIGIDYYIRLSSREFMDSVLNSLGVPKELHVAAFRAVDKADKIGANGVSDLLAAAGLSDKQANGIIALLSSTEGEQEKLEFLRKAGVPESAMRDFSQLLDALGRYSLRGAVRIDLSVVRGLDYYTSTVFEFMSTNKDMNVSIGGGGRYDGLIGLYSGKGVTATGMSLGVDRVLNVLGYESSLQYTYAKVIVNHIKDSNFPYALKVANALRDRGINCDINLASRNIANQFAYADSMRLGYAIIVGDEEERLGKLKLRNLVTGGEEMLSLEEAETELSK